jgi:Flp pilus assembly pilin Flp
MLILADSKVKTGYLLPPAACMLEVGGIPVPESSPWVSVAKGICRDERGQDLVEYALMAGFVAIAGGAAFPPIAGSAYSVFSKVMIQTVKAVNGTELSGSSNELTFTVNRFTQRSAIRVVNRETRDVIRQIPAEYVLRVAEDVGRGSQV